MLAASVVGYLLRGDAGRIVPALVRGVVDGLRVRGGPPPAALTLAPSRSA